MRIRTRLQRLEQPARVARVKPWLETLAPRSLAHRREDRTRHGPFGAPSTGFGLEDGHRLRSQAAAGEPPMQLRGQHFVRQSQKSTPARPKAGAKAPRLSLTTKTVEQVVNRFCGQG